MRRILIAGVVTIAAVALPAAARAQFSAISAVRTGNILESAPIFSPSALVLPRGGVSVGGNALWVAYDEDAFEGADVSGAQLSGGVAFGLTDRITVGAAIPWASVTAEAGGEKADASGLLDLSVFGRARLWTSPGGRTDLAALASVTVPTASGDFDVEGVDRGSDVTLGGAATHRLERGSLHGSVSYTIAGDVDVEGIGSVSGNDVVGLTGAVVYPAAEAVSITGEVGVAVPDEGDTAASLAGGVRWLATPGVFVDAGALVPLSESAVSAAFLVGLTWSR